MTYLPESFILKSVTLQCHLTTAMEAGTCLHILDFDKNLLLTSKPLPNTCSNAAYATFEFEDNNVVFHNHQIYWIQYTPDIAAKLGNADVTSTDGTHTFITYYSGGSFLRQIFIYKIEFYTPQHIYKGFVMRDIEDETKNYLVQIKNGEFNITTLT